MHVCIIMKYCDSRENSSGEWSNACDYRIGHKKKIKHRLIRVATHVGGKSMDNYTMRVNIALKRKEYDNII